MDRASKDKGSLKENSNIYSQNQEDKLFRPSQGILGAREIGEINGLST